MAATKTSDNSAEEVGVGVIGLGYMGRTHIAAYDAARQAGHPCRLVAVCDRNPHKCTSLTGVGGNPRGPGLTPSRGAGMRAYTDPDQLLHDDAVHLISICTHTDTHVEFAVRALNAGKHVLVEKPIALRSKDVQRLVQASSAAPAQRAGLGSSAPRCMPAFCMRFWPGWSWLKEQIDAQIYGPVRSAVFRRLGSAPDWAPHFYGDPARSGGALVDMHIHDADFIRWCFGDPGSVVSGGSIDHVTTIYRYARGPEHVVAEAGWDRAPGLAFNMTYRVAFEEAMAEFDFTHSPPLRLTRGGRVESIELGPLSGYDVQIRHLLEAVADSNRPLMVTMEEAAKVTELLEAERHSLETRQAVELP